MSWENALKENDLDLPMKISTMERAAAIGNNVLFDISQQYVNLIYVFAVAQNSLVPDDVYIHYIVNLKKKRGLTVAHPGM